MRSVSAEFTASAASAVRLTDDEQQDGRRDDHVVVGGPALDATVDYQHRAARPRHEHRPRERRPALLLLARRPAGEGLHCRPGHRCEEEHEGRDHRALRVHVVKPVGCPAQSRDRSRVSAATQITGRGTPGIDFWTARAPYVQPPAAGEALRPAQRVPGRDHGEGAADQEDRRGQRLVEEVRPAVRSFGWGVVSGCGRMAGANNMDYTW